MKPLEQRGQIVTVGDFVVCAYDAGLPKLPVSPWRSYFRRHGNRLPAGPVVDVREREKGGRG